MEKINSDVTEALEILLENGFSVMKNPNFYARYEYNSGSISHYTKVTLGEFTEVKNPLDEPVIACFVQYNSFHESGEALCDYERTEKKYVALADLSDYLNSKGIKMPEFIKDSDLER